MDDTERGGHLNMRRSN